MKKFPYNLKVIRIKAELNTREQVSQQLSNIQIQYCIDDG